jgi:hypothetical protein
MNWAATALVGLPSIQRVCIPSRELSGRKMAEAISLCSFFNSARDLTL